MVDQSGQSGIGFLQTRYDTRSPSGSLTLSIPFSATLLHHPKSILSSPLTAISSTLSGTLTSRIQPPMVPPTELLWVRRSLGRGWWLARIHYAPGPRCWIIGCQVCRTHRRRNDVTPPPRHEDRCSSEGSRECAWGPPQAGQIRAPVGRRCLASLKQPPPFLVKQHNRLERPAASRGNSGCPNLRYERSGHFDASALVRRNGPWKCFKTFVKNLSTMASIWRLGTYHHHASRPEEGPGDLTSHPTAVRSSMRNRVLGIMLMMYKQPVMTASPGDLLRARVLLRILTRRSIAGCARRSKRAGAAPRNDELGSVNTLHIAPECLVDHEKLGPKVRITSGPWGSEWYVSDVQFPLRDMGGRVAELGYGRAHSH